MAFDLGRLGWTVGVSVGLVGCLLPGFDVGGTGGSSTTSASSSSAGGAGGAGGAELPLCESEGLPNPPPVSSSGGGGAGGGGEPTLSFALRDFDLGDASSADLPGLDLDRTCTCCTCQNLYEACPRPSFAVGDAACDGPAGVDNAFAGLFAAIPGDVGSAELNEDALAGLWTILVEIEGYNGLADDDQVTIALYTTAGHKTDAAAMPTTPAWDGSDVWMRRQDSVDAGGEPVVRTLEGYVRDHVVVGELDGFLTLGAELGSRVIFQGGLVRARLEPVPGGFRLVEGRFGGRWALADIFAALSSIRIAGLPICTDNPLYDYLKDAVCAAPDVYSQGFGANRCDAVSFGMAFEGHPVAFAPTLAATSATEGCSPEVDPANDCCERQMPGDVCP
jgi:hypothetical protein